MVFHVSTLDFYKVSYLAWEPFIHTNLVQVFYHEITQSWDLGEKT